MDVSKLGTQPCKHICIFCKEETSQQVHVLQREDGSLTGNLQQIDDLLRSYWLDIFRLYESLPEPSWAAFRDRYQRCLPARSAMQQTPLTPERLKSTLDRMDKGSSMGADGWRVAELQAMPEAWLSRLCSLFHHVEATGKWPRALQIGLISPIPKEQGLKAKHTRPITVMSTVYRLWAATRVQELLQWQEKWISPRLHSYRPERGCEDAWWSQA